MVNLFQGVIVMPYEKIYTYVTCCVPAITNAVDWSRTGYGPVAFIWTQFISHLAPSRSGDTTVMYTQLSAEPLKQRHYQPWGREGCSRWEGHSRWANLPTPRGMACLQGNWVFSLLAKGWLLTDWRLVDRMAYLLRYTTFVVCQSPLWHAFCKPKWQSEAAPHATNQAPAG